MLLPHPHQVTGRGRGLLYSVDRQGSSIDSRYLGMQHCTVPLRTQSDTVSVQPENPTHVRAVQSTRTCTLLPVGGLGAMPLCSAFLGAWHTVGGAWPARMRTKRLRPGTMSLLELRVCWFWPSLVLAWAESSSRMENSLSLLLLSLGLFGVRMDPWTRARLLLCRLLEVSQQLIQTTRRYGGGVTELVHTRTSPELPY